MAKRLKDLSQKFVEEPTSYFDYLSLVPKQEREIIDRVDQWSKKHLTTNQINQCYDEAKFPTHLIQPLRELNIAKYFLGKHGGQPINALTQGMILATLASYDASVALFLMLQAPLCGRTIQRLGSEQHKNQYIPDLIGLKKIWGWALTEQKIGSYASQIETNVKKTKQGYILNGNKRWIGNGDGDYLIVYAKNLDEKKINGFIVDMKLQGITRQKIQKKLGMRQVQNCQIYFKNVLLPLSSLLPEATSYRKGVEKILMSSRYYVIFITYGVCMGVYRSAIAYTSNRVQFGQPTSSFQIVQQKLVKIMSNVQAIGAVCWRISDLQSKGQATIGIIAMFKAWVTQRAREISRWGRQVMGGNGITHDRYIMKAITDIEALYTLQGTYDINTLIAGREITGMPAFKSQKTPYSSE